MKGSESVSDGKKGDPSDARENPVDGRETQPDWPSQVQNKKVFVSYFEREEEEFDNNDK